MYPPQTEYNGHYGRVSLVSGFKRTLKNDDLLSPRYKKAPHLVVKHTAIQIPYKMHRTYTIC